MVRAILEELVARREANPSRPGAKVRLRPKLKELSRLSGWGVFRQQCLNGVIDIIRDFQPPVLRELRHLHHDVGVALMANIHLFARRVLLRVAPGMDNELLQRLRGRNSLLSMEELRA